MTLQLDEDDIVRIIDCINAANDEGFAFTHDLMLRDRLVQYLRDTRFFIGQAILLIRHRQIGPKKPLPLAKMMWSATLSRHTTRTESATAFGTWTTPLAVMSHENWSDC